MRIAKALLTEICIDAGYGGTDPGAIGEDRCIPEEQGVDLPSRFLLEEELENRGHWVVMTHWDCTWYGPTL